MLFTDDRGRLHSLSDLPFKPTQILVSTSRKGTLRGLHKSPYAKWIYCLEGCILDFFVHPEDGETEVQLRSGDSVYVPAGAPHGFYALEDAQIVYLLDGAFDAATDENIFWNTPEWNFPSVRAPRWISDKDAAAPYARPYDVLLLGASGFLGSHAKRALEAAGMSVLSVDTRLRDAATISQHIKKSRCSYVVCAAGISGRPTIDWCEDHEYETWETNYLDMLNLMRTCHEHGAHLTIFGSGMVYKGGDKPITETHPPDFVDKVYTKYRILLESATQLFPASVLYLRILYPVTFDGHEKCFFTKMTKRADSVHDIAVPLTVVPALFPLIPAMLRQRACGVFNFVNEGLVRLPWLLETAGIPYQLAAASDTTKRGDFVLDVSKLKSLGIAVQTVRDAIVTYLSQRADV